MATVIPPTSNVEAAYEDMFKEITRKLYGEETGNGLHTLGTPVAQVATTGPTAAPDGEQRSFTNLVRGRVFHTKNKENHKRFQIFVQRFRSYPRPTFISLVSKKFVLID